MPERLITAKVSKCMDRINDNTDNPNGEYLQDILKEFAYEIMELCGKPVDAPQRSKFMEEVEDKMPPFFVPKEDLFSVIEIIYKRFCTLVKLIDKYKADK